MIEFLIVVGLGAVIAVRVAVMRRAALRRARLRAEAVLDELVAQARTCRELDALVARHAMRRGAIELAERSVARVRAAVRPGALVRR